MKDNRKKLVLFDIDGTLYDNNNKEVPESTKKALVELKKHAHIGIATGRAEFMLYSLEELIDLFDDFVLINGQYIKSDGQVIYKDAIDFKLLDKICKQMESLDIAYGFEGSHDEAISKLDDRARQSFDRLGLNLPPIDKDYYHKKEVYQAWAFCDEKHIEILKRDNPEFQFIKWMDVGYDILPISSNKGLGVKRLGEYLNISQKDIVVFGDGDNDYEMIKYAGLGIAMGNATDKVKNIADYVTENVDEDGIYNALKHFKLI